ncbi:TMEM14 family [Dillenia turbinata]|uniref:TMEM14 family n=1 Tax=Dillenia turbinata TaxID=194707 RepID=A0AAN8ZD42_9MAGN
MVRGNLMQVLQETLLDFCISEIVQHDMLSLNWTQSEFQLAQCLGILMLTIRMSLDGHGTETSRTNLSSTSDASRSYIQQTGKPQLGSEDHLAGNIGHVEEAQEPTAIQKKMAAKIHDFCFGIPFGGLVLSGGLLGFIISRNLATLSTLLYGGALLALSTFSLKIWRQGKSSLPFILGQAVLSGALLWKNMQSYSLTNKIFPSGFLAVISAAMLCFYSYVIISGGNPPPKKLETCATVKAR